MRINHNVAALNTYARLNEATNAQGKSLEKLSSGQRINKAGDDAAGLAISEKMRNQIKGLGQASRNAQDGISMIQTAEGALNETHSMLLRMRELSVQSNNDTNTATDRSRIQEEIIQLRTEITSIGDKTEFNTKKLIDGTLGTAANTGTLQIGANANQQLDLTIGDMRASAIGNGASMVSDIDVTLAPAAQTNTQRLAILDGAINQVSAERSKMGAWQNRLEHTINNLGTSSENLTAAESRVRDVDMAKEMMEFTKNNILNQASTAMLAQANQQPQGVLQLLK